MQHLTPDQLAAGLPHIEASPANDGVIEMIVQRPAEDQRVLLDEAEINEVEGLAGDTWNQRPSRKSVDGGPHPDMQVTLINARALALIAQDRERMPLAGDQLVVDMDLGVANLPPWTKLAVGDAVLEVTDQPHTGCAKFSQRFGVDAHRWVNSEQGRALNLRGINTRVVRGGTVRVGDTVRKL